MRYSIVHRSPDRLRLALARGRLSSREADVLYYALLERRDVVKVQVFARTGEVAIRFRQSAEELLDWLDSLSLSGVVPTAEICISGKT